MNYDYNPFLISEDKLSSYIKDNKITLDGELDGVSSALSITWIRLHWDSITKIERALLRPDAQECCHDYDDLKKMAWVFDGYLIWIGTLYDAPEWYKKIYDSIKDNDDGNENNPGDNNGKIPNKGNTGKIDSSIIDEELSKEIYKYVKKVDITISFNKKLKDVASRFYLPILDNASSLAMSSSCSNQEYEFLYKEIDTLSITKNEYIKHICTFKIYDVLDAYNRLCPCDKHLPYAWAYNHSIMFSDYDKVDSRNHPDLKCEMDEEDYITKLHITSEEWDKPHKMMLFWTWVDDVALYDSMMSIEDNTIYWNEKVE